MPNHIICVWSYFSSPSTLSTLKRSTSTPLTVKNVFLAKAMFKTDIFSTLHIRQWCGYNWSLELTYMSLSVSLVAWRKIYKIEICASVSHTWVGGHSEISIHLQSLSDLFSFLCFVVQSTALHKHFSTVNLLCKVHAQITMKHHITFYNLWLKNHPIIC